MTTRPGRTPDQLAETAAFVFGVDKRAILGSSRVARVAEARQALAWALRQQDWSLESIGAFLRRDHTTIIFALKAVEARRAHNARFAERLTILVDPTQPAPVDWQARVEELERRVVELEQIVGKP